MNDNDDEELNIEQLKIEIERMLQEDAKSIQRINELLEELSRNLEEDDPHQDKFLRIEDALCMPEMGGKKYLLGPSVPSDTMTEGMVREAIRSGQLTAFKPNKNLFVTRRSLKEWMTACRVDANNPISTFCQNTKTRTGPSRSQSGQSNIMTRELADRKQSAQALALAKAQKLRNSMRSG
ncbi:hypothetical protein [Rhizobium laguerreae]|uniref:hypothetical protein n=1 Tax=Rhizobium laguerreae TaxID=1076926 RepID=UPI001C9007AF|nr:hypothetical protein [Rhizobium laguerreae]MBY3363792.1 hypothetical protein [Rhizobium laguerreae]